MLIGQQGFDHIGNVVLELNGLFVLLERLDAIEKEEFQAEMQSVLDRWLILKGMDAK